MLAGRSSSLSDLGMRARRTPDRFDVHWGRRTLGATERTAVASERTSVNLSVAQPATSAAPALVISTRRAPPEALPTYRVNIMRVAYLLMAVGLAFVELPLLPGASSLPVYEGVVAALLSAMCLLAFLGLRYPVQMLPLLLLECAWKLIWLAAVALPHLAAGDMDEEMSGVLISVSLVVILLAVTPWDFVWKRYVIAPGEPWRERAELGK